MIKEAFKWLVSTPQEPRPWWKVIVLEASVCGIWSAVTRAALCAGRGTAFARRPAAAVMLKKRRRAEYRLPPHSRSVCQACE